MSPVLLRVIDGWNRLVLALAVAVSCVRPLRVDRGHGVRKRVRITGLHHTHPHNVDTLARRQGGREERREVPSSVSVTLTRFATPAPMLQILKV